MKNLKKLLSAVLAVAMVLSMVAVLAGCSNEESPNTGSDATQPGANGETAVYSINVKSIGGMPMSDLDVYVYTDSTLSDLQQFGRTDTDGSVSLEMPVKDTYAITLTGLPKGYEVESSYSFNGTSANITVNSALVKGESLSGAVLSLGDVMYDFSVTTPAGETVTLSEMLAEKDVVLLNFFFTTCGPCANEFPYMEEAYQMYKDSVGVIALDPLEQNEVVGGYQQSMGLTFPMAACPAVWSTTFGIQGYPTSVLVDRYGVICAIEVGGITSLRPFASAFEHFTGDDYQQIICQNGISDLITTIKPNQTMPSSEEIAAVINNGDLQITYRAEEDPDSAAMAWPFVIGEKNGEACVMTSNAKVEDSFAIMYADVYLEKGQAFGFDYLASTEYGADVMYVIVENEDIYAISGADEEEAWKSCYPWVAQETGTYEIALCYLKDSDGNEGDDAIYIKNARVVDVSAIDTASYIPFKAASTEDGFEYNYVDIVLNEEDGYYHVGDANGPLLLADMMNYTEFSEEETLWTLVYDNALKVDGVTVYDEMVNYFSYASNSSLNGVCTVNAELAELLKKVAGAVGFNPDDANEWMKFCKYYQAYGTDGVQLVDPIKGLAPFSAYTASLGKNVESNYFYYDHIIMPRGLLAEFVPNRSGVYRITSRNDSGDGVEGWIFDENRTELYVHEPSERMYTMEGDISMLYYMEAGKPYYIDIAFWDVYGTGYIYYDIEYVASEYDVFSLCSQGYFTYDTDATGEAMYHTVTGGINVVLNEADGIYYEDLGQDANGNQRYGSKIYADFTGVTNLFGRPIATVNTYDENGNVIKDENGNAVTVTGMIDMGAFNLATTETDEEILSYMRKYDGDVEATNEYLKAYWGEEYEQNAEIYQIEDVFAGKYHGTGEDYTDVIKAYLDDMITSPAERKGCVVVTEELAQLLQLLMDKYTFAGVDNSWTKLCYYYKHLGPN